MSSSNVAQLIPTVQDALRAFLSTLIGKDAPLTIDPPLETTLKEASAQAMAYIAIVAGSPELQYAVMLEEKWLPLLSQAMLGETLQAADSGADDLIRELAGQAHGTIRNTLDSTGTPLPEVSFEVLHPGTELSTGALPAQLLEISFGVKIEDVSLGGFALIPQMIEGAAKTSPSPQPKQARPEFSNNMADTVQTVDVAPLAFPDLGSEVLRGDGGNGNFGLLSEVELEVTVELGRRKLPLADLLRLTTGSVVELEKLVGEPLEVYANGRLIAEGEAVVIDEQFGIRITTLASSKARAKAFV